MNNISFFKALLMKELNEKELSDKQKDIADEAPPKNKITGADFKALRAKKGVKKEGEDHEVSMAHNSLKSIVSSASQLMNLLGNDEKDIPAWIQDHITNAENYINQASKNYHEYNEGEHDMDELPDGTEELPAGDAEDAEMSLKGLMETVKGKKNLKEFGPSIANVSKARFKLEDVINWFTKKQQAKELKHGFKGQFKDFINRLKSHAESENGYIPVNYVYHDINDYVAYWPTEWSREEYAVQEKLQNKHAKELYSAIRSELKMYDRKGNPIN